MTKNGSSTFYFRVSKLDLIIGLLVTDITKNLVNPGILVIENPYVGIPVFFAVSGFLTFVSAIVGGFVRPTGGAS